MSIEGHIGPLYHILLHLFTRVFGVSEFALRTPSAIYGVVSVLLLYYLAKDLFDKKVARLAALLLALCPLHIWYSQESRMYSLWVMLILACLIVFSKILKEANWRLWFALIVLASLSVWTFINSVFVFAAMGFYLLVYVKEYRHKVWHFSLAIIIAVLTYLPGIIVYLTTKKSNIGSTRATSIVDLAYAFFVYSIGSTFGPSLTEIRAQIGTQSVFDVLIEHGPCIFPVLLVFGVLLIVALYNCWKKRLERNYVLLVVLVAMPVLFVFAIAYLSPSLPFNIRYTLSSLPLYMLLLAIGIYSCKKEIHQKLLTGLIVLFFIFSLRNHYFEAKYSKVDFREIVHLLNEHSDINEVMIFHEYANIVMDYYGDPSEKMIKYNVDWNTSLHTFIKRLSASASEKIIFVKTRRTHMYNAAELNKIERYLDENYLRDEFIENSAFDFVVYKPK